MRTDHDPFAPPQDYALNDGHGLEVLAVDGVELPESGVLRVAPEPETPEPSGADTPEIEQPKATKRRRKPSREELLKELGVQ